MIFFDIDGTLIDHASASAAASLIFFDQFPGAIPFSRDEYPAAWERILNKHFNRFCRGEVSLWEQRRARTREVFAAPEMSDDEADGRYKIFIREYEALTRPYEDAAPCLEKLTGQPLGIISNGVREQQIGKLQRAGLLKYFSVMVYSEDVGLGKPSPTIFLEACRRAGDSYERCVHIGDDLEADVTPSRSLGMRGIHLSRTGKSPVGPPVISTLNNLAEILQ
ncbi:MAG TPA: HAD family hydrolase [Terriglobales bacterium]|jgi:putative hydrolase of the HAD superfamily|nr:HAD family hydrolase [Terriglobales bacterium]